MTFEPFASRTHEKMKEVLMSPEAEGPAIHYYMIRGSSEKRNITVWETGTVGGEYIKAYGHYHVDDLPETYWTIAGQGVILLQKLVAENGILQADRVEDFKAIKVRAGDTIKIPGDYGHLGVNTGTTWFVTEDDSPVATTDSASMPVHADYETVKKMRGFAYYVVEKNSVPTLVRNSHYKEVRKSDFGGIAAED
jgi:oxalate decarboxylase/phosphoglucose isomerase-like protein (cupin superfamily)